MKIKHIILLLLTAGVLMACSTESTGTSGTGMRDEAGGTTTAAEVGMGGAGGGSVVR